MNPKTVNVKAKIVIIVYLIAGAGTVSNVKVLSSVKSGGDTMGRLVTGWVALNKEDAKQIIKKLNFELFSYWVQPSDQSKICCLPARGTLYIRGDSIDDTADPEPPNVSCNLP